MQDEFSLFPPKYAIGVHGYMLVYSITSKQSFDMIVSLHEKILDQGGLDRVPCVIVGQKSDLNSERRVTFAEGEALAKKLGAAFIESSAKDNKNIGECGARGANASELPCSSRFAATHPATPCFGANPRPRF